MIINCPDCGHKVSSDAPLCRYCGCPGEKLREKAENEGKGCGCIIVAVIIFAALVYVYNAVNEQLGLGLSQKTIITLVIATVPSVVLWWITVPALYKIAKQKMQGKNSLSLLLALSYIVITGMIIFGVCSHITDKMSASKKQKIETIDKERPKDESKDASIEAEKTTSNSSEAVIETDVKETPANTESGNDAAEESVTTTEQQSCTKSEEPSKDTIRTVSLQNLLKLTE